MHNHNTSEHYLCPPYLQENKTGKLFTSLSRLIKSQNKQKNKQMYYLSGLAETTTVRLETITQPCPASTMHQHKPQPHPPGGLHGLQPQTIPRNGR